MLLLLLPLWSRQLHNVQFFAFTAFGSFSWAITSWTVIFPTSCASNLKSFMFCLGFTPHCLWITTIAFCRCAICPVVILFVSHFLWVSFWQPRVSVLIINYLRLFTYLASSIAVWRVKFTFICSFSDSPLSKIPISSLSLIHSSFLSFKSVFFHVRQTSYKWFHRLPRILDTLVEKCLLINHIMLRYKLLIKCSQHHNVIFLMALLSKAKGLRYNQLPCPLPRLRKYLVPLRSPHGD